jgi:hypothetical protein
MTVSHAQEGLGPDIGTALVKVSSKAVPQNMCSHPLIETGMLPSFAASLLQRGDVHRIIWIAPRKQPTARSGQTPVGSQDAGLQAADLADPQPGGGGRHQRNAVAQGRYGLQETGDFVRTQHQWLLDRLAGRNNVLNRLLAPERHRIEKTLRASHLVDVGPRPLQSDQVQLVRTHLLRAELVG